MSHRIKGKNGDGAGTQMQTHDKPNLPARRNDGFQAPAQSGQHPLGRLRDEVDSLFDRFFGQWPMPMEWSGALGQLWDLDVDETDKEIVVRAEAPGFEPKDFDVHMTGDRLTIRAEHQQEGEQTEGESRFWQRRYGRYQRSLTLPAFVNGDKVEAQYRNGVLELHLPRVEEAQRRRIDVKS